jgi:signal transduction histidine kinase
MMPPPLPADEQARLQELYRLEILDTEAENQYDEVVALASQICKVPISLISLVDVNRQWFKAKLGVLETETPREVSFCAHMLAQDTELLQVPDAHLDERFSENPLVTSAPNIRFYAGVPLVTSNGYKLGSLCVIDRKPNSINEDQAYALRVLSNQIMRMIELKVKNKEIEEQKKHIEQQNKIQQKMLSIIAHDVRSPLASIRQALEMELDDFSKEERQMIIGELQSQVTTTLNLLNNLVDWGSEQILGTVNKNKIATNLYELVATEIPNFLLAANFKNNTIVNNIHQQLMVYTNPSMLLFVLRNLVTNALKFTENGCITLNGNIENNLIHLSVSDTGIGMSEAAIDNLLNKKLSKTTIGTKEEKGSGLGLLLAQDFIALLKGSISIESTVGKGTTVHMYFPV